MSRATVRRLFTARRSPPVTADDFLRGAGRRIITAQRYVLVILDGLMLAAAASFARQVPRAGPPANLLAAALATPLPAHRPLCRPPSPFLPVSRLVLVLRWIFLQPRGRRRCPAYSPPHRLLPPVSSTSCLTLVLRRSCLWPCYHRHRFARGLSPLPLPPVSPASHLLLALR